MIKIFLTIRNRLAITKKCITAIQKHTKMPYQLYVYNNQTNYRFDEHIVYLMNLFKKGLITQVIFNSNASTYNAFSKASACNQFGVYHQLDPQKDKYKFLLMLDNDIILTPGWDKKLNIAWNFVKRSKMDHIKVIGQNPGGIKGKKTPVDIKDLNSKVKFIGRLGKLGGSALWATRSNFFEDVGTLDLKQLVNQDKQHDQLYWQLMEKASNGRSYILGVNTKLGIHCGRLAGSVCNQLSRNRNNKNKLDIIKFPTLEEQIDSQTFDEFFAKITNDKRLINDW